MAINSADVKITVLPEETFGVTPVTGTRYVVPTKTGYSLPEYSANEIASETIMPNRTSNGSRRGNGSGTGTFDLEFIRAPVVEFLMESAVGGKFSSNVLKGGKTDSYFSTIAELADDMVQVNAGGTVNSFSLSAVAAEGVTASFGYQFAKQDNLAELADDATTVTPVPNVYHFLGSEVTNVTIGGASLVYSELTFDVNHDGTFRNVLGSNVAAGISKTGTRTVKATLKAYLESFSVHSAITGLAQPLSFDVGTTGNGYRFTIPAAIGMIPKNETANDIMVSIDFTAKYDATSGSDIIVTKL